jgi:hypothetical protein
VADVKYFVYVSNFLNYVSMIIVFIVAAIFSIESESILIAERDYNACIDYVEFFQLKVIKFVFRFLRRFTIEANKKYELHFELMFQAVVDRCFEICILPASLLPAII